MIWFSTIACGLFTTPPTLPAGRYRAWDSAWNSEALEALVTCQPTPSTEIELQQATRFFGERFLIGEAVYADVTLDGREWRVLLDEPVDASLRSKMLEDADGDCPSLTFTPLRTPGLFLVHTPRGTYIANPAFGFRLLEGSSGGMLEGCRVQGDTVHCFLDMHWGPGAVFGPDGVERNGTFEPWWQRAR